MKRLIIKEIEMWYYIEPKSIMKVIKDILTEKARNKYRELSGEEKNIEREYGRNKYHMSKEKKQKLYNIHKNVMKLKGLSLVVNKIVF